MTYKDACAYAGISEQTLWTWRTTAEKALADMDEGGSRAGKTPLKKDIPYIEFLYELQAVEQKTQVRLAKTQLKLAQGGGRIRETVTTEVLLPNEAGEFVVARKETREHLKELPPDGTAGRYMLDRRFGWDKGGANTPVESNAGSVADFKAKAEQRREEAKQALFVFADLEEGDADDG
jgi:hypothetical protein